MNDMPECSTRLHRKARKDHKCSTCHAKIEKCTIYLFISGIWSGDPKSFKLCNNCEKVMDNFRLMDEYLSWDEGPSLCLGGVHEFLQGFLCIRYNGIEAAEDMSKTLGVPLWYTKKMVCEN